MASENEPAKLILPYLQRADELQKHEPLISYYCRLYAMERGLKIPQGERTKTTNALLVSLMKQLEKDKKSLKLTPDDSLHIEGFALNVFARADKQDRSGRADLNTAKTFYAASIFFEILNQFGPLQPDLEQKQKYAVWKAADIRKALKEGRKPIPGPPGGDEDLSVPSSSPSSAYDLGPNETTVSSPHPEPDASPKFFNSFSNLPSAHISPPRQFIDTSSSPNIPPPPPLPPQFHEEVNDNQRSGNTPPPSSFPTASYPSHDYHPLPPANESESSSYSQQYHHQSYPQEHQPHIPHNYPLPPLDASSTFSYPHFQSYPSFTEASLPSVPTQFPSFYQGSDSTSYSSHSMPPSANYSSDSRYHSISRDGPVSEPKKITPTSSTSSYQYDSNYMPPPDKIAEAHKAARFAVGALAFDDVSVAVEFLNKSLEMLTNPSACQ